MTWKPVGKLPRERNYTYADVLGVTEHSSDLIPTPWPTEGSVCYRGYVRRVPPRRVRTAAQTAELRRLAAIENPGRCRARRKQVDMWCHQRPTKRSGYTVCGVHGPKFRHWPEQKLVERVRRELSG